MNEQIRELAEQAKFVAEETINKKISKNAELDAFAEKFAELIVSKCLSIMDRHYDASIASDEIKEHFGVTE
jgi:hypothetical protein